MKTRASKVKVKDLKYIVPLETMAKEDKFSFQRFYPDDRVRLRGSEDRTIGTVIRSNQKEDGGTQVKWDGRRGVRLHNPRFLENVWLDEEGEEV